MSSYVTPPSAVAAALNELELATLDKDGNPPKESRMTSVKNAASLYVKLVQADEESARKRSKLDAMFDGVSPYDQAVLKSTGQGARTNVNFGEAQRLLDVGLSSFVDLYSSLKRLVNVRIKRSAAGEFDRTAAEQIIGEEISDAVRKWPEFHSHYLRLATEYTKHGAGFVYFDNAVDWRFRVSGLADFLFPRQSRASEEALEVCCVKFPYMLHELYRYIDSENRVAGSASSQNWNLEEIKRVIVRNAKTDSRTSGVMGYDWERAAREFKNNDLYMGMENTTVDIVHMWVKEFDGSISFFIFAADNPQEFLLKEVSVFKSAQQAYIAFTQGVGPNGTFHSIRGLGQRIFAHIQMSNRLRCQMVDSAMLAGSVMLQPDSERSLQKLSYTMYGPYSILPPQLNVVDKTPPNLSSAMQPALTDVSTQLALNADPSTVYQQQSSPYRNERQVENDVAISTRLTGSTLNLFYAAWSRLWQEIVRRMVENQDDPYVQRILQNMEERGIDPKLFSAIDTDLTFAVKAIGNGSAIARLANLRDLYTVAGNFDDVGNLNLTRDITSELVGFDLVDRYAPPTPEPRTTNATKIALIENAHMEQGMPLPVLSEEPHGEHIRAHLPRLNEIIAGIDSGEIDPMQALSQATVFHEHITQHNAALANSKNAQGLYKSTKQILQQSGEIIANFSKRLMKMQREAAQQQQEAVGGEAMQGGQPQAAPVPTPAELKYQEHQVRMRIAEEVAMQEMRLKELKQQQELALRDAKEAASMGPA
jgi:hypothetical protein